MCTVLLVLRFIFSAVSRLIAERRARHRVKSLTARRKEGKKRTRQPSAVEAVAEEKRGEVAVLWRGGGEKWRPACSGGDVGVASGTDSKYFSFSARLR